MLANVISLVTIPIIGIGTCITFGALEVLAQTEEEIEKIRYTENVCSAVLISALILKLIRIFKFVL